MAQLTESQRYVIEVMLAQDYNKSSIAKAINKDKSVVYREIERNKDKRNGKYKSKLAQKKTTKRHTEKAKKNYFTEKIKERIEKLLLEKYSPEQIVGYCKKENLSCVSTERIYQHIWANKKQGGDLHAHLRRKGKKYRNRGKMKDNRGILKNRIPITERPQEVEKKQRFGDLEVDTIIGKSHKGAIVTINDRATGLLWMKKVEKREAKLVKQAIIELLTPFKQFLHTMTADNGKEFALHEEIKKELNIDFYFAEPYHSWQRGANENLNGLIRQFIPKKSIFSLLSSKFIDKVQQNLNSRPRKRFSFESPLTIFNQKLHL